MPSLLPVKTAVIGASGNVGRYLWRSYRCAHPDCVGTSFSHPGDGLTFFDIRKPDLAAFAWRKRATRPRDLFRQP